MKWIILYSLKLTDILILLKNLNFTEKGLIRLHIYLKIDTFILASLDFAIPRYFSDLTQRFFAVNLNHSQKPQISYLGHRDGGEANIERGK